MKDINDVMPKLPKDHVGALLNYRPGQTELKQLAKILPFDSKWHTIFSHDNTVSIDGKVIRKQSPKSWT